MNGYDLVRKQTVHDNTVAEVNNARTSGVIGTKYNTLKERLDDVDTSLINIVNY